MTTVCNAPSCDKPLPQTTGKRARRYCDATCRNRAAAARRANPDAVASLPAPAADTTLADVVRRDLEAGGRLDTLPGQLAVALARRITAEGTTASSVATLSKELRALMAEALAGVKPREPDFLDELEERRLAKVAGA